MNKKSLLYIIGAVILLLIVYHLFHHKQTQTKVPLQPAQLVKPKEQAPSAAAPVESQDQQLIDKYSAQINAGKTDNGNVYFQRGLIYLKLQQSRQAIGDFTAALKISPNSAYLLYNRALAYRLEQQLDSAVTDLNAAIKAKKDFVDAYNTRGLIYVDQQNFDDALTDYNEAIKLNPKFTEAYFNLGTLYTREKKFDDAKKVFTQAISLYVPPSSNASPEDIAKAKKDLLQAYLNRANVEMEAGDLKSALADATYVVTNAPQSMEALRMRAAIYDKMGNSAQATTDSAAADSLSLQNMLNAK